VKRLLIIITVVSLVLVSLTFAVGAETIGSRLVFYVRVARLYTETADAKISMPLKDVSKKQIANTWHALRGSDRLHEGQDIFAPRGTPVYSATRGYVYKVGEDNLGGHTVSVIGAGGRIYYYAHLDSYAPNIAVGDAVTTRSLLGYVGSTGNANGTPSHLHFGVYASDGAINPLPLLTDRPKDPQITQTKTGKQKTLKLMRQHGSVSRN
jgi:murein DD-endopeptidase MepM/ murein hydrolase activator NlpD